MARHEWKGSSAPRSLNYDWLGLFSVTSVDGEELKLTSSSLTPIVRVRGSGDWAVKRLFPDVVSSGLRRRRGRCFTLTSLCSGTSEDFSWHKPNHNDNKNLDLTSGLMIANFDLLESQKRKKNKLQFCLHDFSGAASPVFLRQRCRFRAHMVPYGLIISH